MEEQQTITEEKKTRRGPKPLGLVRCNAMITLKQKRKIEKVRKINRLDSEAQALRFILDEFGSF